MRFTSTTTSYGTGAGPPDGYARAAAAWDERIGSARVQAHHWRLAAFGCLALALLSTSAAVYLGVKKQVATYVVEVDRAGMPGRITLASEAYRPEAAQVGYFVGEVVRLTRGRPLDPVVLRQQWTTAYHFLAGAAVNAMNEYAAADGGVSKKPGEGPLARTVEITSILQKSTDTYQVRWVEATYGGGLLRSRESYAGLFQVRLMQPRDEADAFRNPIGAYVTGFTWSREFTGPVGRDEPARPADAVHATGGTTP